MQEHILWLLRNIRHPHSSGEYTLYSATEVKIDNYIGAGGDVTIPSSVDIFGQTYSVIGVLPNSFKGKKSDKTLATEEFVNLAGVVLADCPCSGIGTVSKKPEIKNRLKPEDCIALAGIQRDILDNVSDYVKPGGKLV